MRDGWRGWGCWEALCFSKDRLEALPPTAGKPKAVTSCTTWTQRPGNLSARATTTSKRCLPRYSHLQPQGPTQLELNTDDHQDEHTSPCSSPKSRSKPCAATSKPSSTAFEAPRRPSPSRPRLHAAGPQLPPASLVAWSGGGRFGLDGTVRWRWGLYLGRVWGVGGVSVGVAGAMEGMR